jgi:hypothetical protein
MKKTVLSIVLTAIPVLSFAQDQQNYQCSIDELTRRVEIFHETGVTVPCEVHYYKDTEAPGEQQVLWRALNEEGYCEAKAAEFVARLEGMGWTCWKAGAEAPAEESVPKETDDTTSLTPAEEPEDIEIEK